LTPRVLAGARSAIAERLESVPLTEPLARALRGSPRPDRSYAACIAGFPRSANTVAFFALQRSDPAARLLHHVHTAAPVLECTRLGIPVAVLVREPLDAISSLVVFRGGAVRPGRAIARYAHFHERIASVADEIVVCGFQEVLSDPSVVAQRLNERFGTSFGAEPLRGEERAAIDRAIEERQTGQGRPAERFAIPRPEKEAAKPAAREAVARHRSFPRALAAYEAVMAARGNEETGTGAAARGRPATPP
jgi:hypothetical protein